MRRTLAAARHKAPKPEPRRAAPAASQACLKQRNICSLTACNPTPVCSSTARERKTRSSPNRRIRSTPRYVMLNQLPPTARELPTAPNQPHQRRGRDGRSRVPSRRTWRSGHAIPFIGISGFAMNVNPGHRFQKFFLYLIYFNKQLKLKTRNFSE